jgi:hypothetical protein
LAATADHELTKRLEIVEDVFRSPAPSLSTGLVQQPVQIVVRFALTI